MLRFLVVIALFTSAITPALASDFDLPIQNNGELAVTAVYLRDAGTTGWFSLLTDPIAPGDSEVISIQDDSTSCIYDLRFEFSDGSELEDMGFNPCSVTGGYTFNK